ncbi:MAG: BtpA/SgcQ family protein [Prochlorococcaceae cyanobacterium]
MAAAPMPESWRTLFRPHRPALIGVLHLPPLPGSPGWGGSFAAVRDRALADADAFLEGGADGLIVENFGDRPFHATVVPPETTAAMAVVAAAVVAAVGEVPLGINVLRNDGLAALAVAAAVEAAFVRVNVLAGAMVTDQGLIEGCAAALLRRRRLLAAEGVAVFADVMVKHAHPLAPQPIGEAVEDTLQRAGAAAVIVSGVATGAPPAMADLRAARAAAAGAPVLVGSGCTAALAPSLAGLVDGVIVASSLKQDGVLDRPVDRQRVRELRRALDGGEPRTPVPDCVQVLPAP